ncbi:MAG: hypothetical protein LBS52_02305 [Dysgonamonadaceae bacterium]|jgi:hypothetical protein|nr:hypothetical protein [Dysgonamonadaceae bacterium]
MKHFPIQKTGRFLLIPLSCVLFALASCDKDSFGSNNEGYGAPVPVKFSVSGVLEPSTTVETRAQKGLVVETVTSPGEFYDISCSLERTPVTRATDVTTPLSAGITYRVIAYRGTTAAAVTVVNYAGHKDYVVGSEDNDWYLLAGNYYFVCYSYNNSNFIGDPSVILADDRLEATQNPASVSIVNTSIGPQAENPDLLYSAQAKTLVNGANTLTIDFNHTWTWINVILDSSDLMDESIFAAAAKIGPTYNSGTLALGTGAITGASAGAGLDSTAIVWNATEFNPAATATPSGNPEYDPAAPTSGPHKNQVVTAVPMRVCMSGTGAAAAKLTFAPASIYAGTDDANKLPNGKWQNLSFGHAMQQGYRYTIRIKLLIPKLKVAILAATPTNDYGYNPAGTTSRSGSILKAANNFGVTGTVVCAGFDFVAYSYEPLNADLKKWITGEGNDGQIADIVYMAYIHYFTTTAITSTFTGWLKDYMKKGGAVVLFPNAAYGNNIATAMADMIFNDSGNGPFPSATLGSSTPSGSIHPLPGNPLYYNSGNPDAQAAAAMAALANDPILNGPFGDVRDKQWGNDADNDVGFLGLSEAPGNGLTIYSRGTDINGTSPNHNAITTVNGFKYETEDYNWVYFGDGGFMSLNDTWANYGENWTRTADWTICPLNVSNIDGLCRPLPRPFFGNATSVLANRKTVYNSIIYANMWAWAIKKSYYYKKKRWDLAHP